MIVNLLHLFFITDDTMKKVLAINCCFREESRTKRIYTPVINCLETKYSVEEIDLSTVDCQPADRQMLKDRENGIAHHQNPTVGKEDV